LSDVRDGTLPKILEGAMNRLKAEAAYSFAEDGVRTAMILFDMRDSADITSRSNVDEVFGTHNLSTEEAHPCLKASEYGPHCNTRHRKKEPTAGAPRQRSACDPDTRVSWCKPDAPHMHWLELAIGAQSSVWFLSKRGDKVPRCFSISDSHVSLGMGSSLSNGGSHEIICNR
jgi:hypothetical protein